MFPLSKRKAQSLSSALVITGASLGLAAPGAIAAPQDAAIALEQDAFSTEIHQDVISNQEPPRRGDERRS
ncbi:MAG: hypothetical protein MH825_09510 [Cyanobacteria bacterium]|nr:hypothetical protein [Cyanobacteriota bacterium]